MTARRAVVVWCLFAALAVSNGVLRVSVVTPLLGDPAAHIIATVLLCTVIATLTWLLLPWLGPESGRDVWILGAAWLSMTVAFEFLAGHLLFGHDWDRLLADYNLARGRVWVLVLITTLLAPVWAYRTRRRQAPGPMTRKPTSDSENHRWTRRP